MDSVKSLLVLVRDLFCYCGVSKDEYKSVKLDAYISNFVVWKYLHMLLLVVFGVIGTLSILFGDTTFDVASRFFMCAYCIVISILFDKVFEEVSVAAQRVIYLTMILLLTFGILDGIQVSDDRAVIFMVLLAVLPMFIIDKPYYVALVLVLAAAIYTILVHGSKTGNVLYADSMGACLYSLLGIIINFFSCRIRIKEFLLTKKEKKYLQEEIRIEQEKQEMNITLGRMSESILELLGDVVESRDHDSGDHIYRVRGFTHILANQVKKDLPEYGLTKYDIDLISYTSVLHDVGKISISDTILLKPGRLSEEECRVMKTHCQKGFQLLEKMKGSWTEDYLNTAKDICLFHHEKWDGKGYPNGLKGDEIPISAQIVSIADIYDALTSDRVYKPAYTHDDAFEMIMSGKCGEFSEKLKMCLARCKTHFAEHAKHPTALAFDGAKVEITAEGNGETQPKTILVGLHDEEKTLQEKERLSEENSVINSLSEDFYYICFVDLIKNEIKQFSCHEEFANILERIDTRLPSNERFDRLLREVIVPIDLDRFRHDVEREKTLLTVKQTGKASADFRIMLKDGIHFCRIKITPAPNNPNALIFGISNIDEIHRKNVEAMKLHEELEATRRESEEKRLLEDRLAVISSMSADYAFLCTLNMVTMEITVYHVKEWFEKMFDNIEDIITSIEVRESALKEIVYPEDLEQAIEASRNEVVAEAMLHNETYSIQYRVMYQDRLLNFQTRYARDAKNPNRITIGIKQMS